MILFVNPVEMPPIVCDWLIQRMMPDNTVAIPSVTMMESTPRRMITGLFTRLVTTLAASAITMATPIGRWRLTLVTATTTAARLALAAIDRSNRPQVSVRTAENVRNITTDWDPRMALSVP